MIPLSDFLQANRLTFWNQLVTPTDIVGYFVYVPFEGHPEFNSGPEMYGDTTLFIIENGYRSAFVRTINVAPAVHANRNTGLVFVFKEAKAAVHFKLRFG